MADNPSPLVQEAEQEFQDYRKFAFNKDMMQIAVGLILATAFNKTVSAISDYLLMPIVNYFVNRNGDWRSMVVHPVEGMNVEIGHLIGAFLDFIILSVVLYIVYVKVYKGLFPDTPPTEKPVPVIEEGEKLVVVEDDKVVVKREHE